MFRNIRKKGSKALTYANCSAAYCSHPRWLALLLQRLFYLQIVQGETYQNNFSLSIRKERTLKSSRGSIYDRNGKPIAYNELSYCVTFEDNGSYSSTHEKNLALNSTLYHVIKIVEEQGDSVIDSFKIALSDDGTWEYTASGFTLNRFKADIFGQAYINDLSSEELEYVGRRSHGASLRRKNTTGFLTRKSLLRSESSTTCRTVIRTKNFCSSSPCVPRLQRTVSSVISRSRLRRMSVKQTVARIMENAASFQGIDISEEYRRVYADAEYIAPSDRLHGSDFRGRA